MKAEAVVRDKSQIGLIDYALTSVGSMLAVYSAGMAVGESSIGTYCSMLVAIGTVFSFAVRTLFAKSVILTVDGIVYAGALATAVILLPRLNGMLPSEGFPREVLVAGALTWMLILGSFCIWRDGTLLFQAIPCIALFGLVGCYATFANVTFAFFGFLLCLATLFARAHTREMLQQAVDSGFFNRADSPGRSTAVERTMALYERIKAGPWRWLAGPEWALASALVVVMVSLLGAPVLQESAKGVSGIVKLPAPPIRSQLPPVVGNQSRAEARVGQGPLTQLSDLPLYEARLDQLRYLRGATFDEYTGDGWRSSLRTPTMGGFDTQRPDEVAREEIADPKSFAFSIRTVNSVDLIPTPGEVTDIRPSRRLVRRVDGTFELSEGSNAANYSGEAVEPRPGSVPKDAQIQLPSSLLGTGMADGIPETVKELARKTAEGGGSDYERALRLKREIERRCQYNLRAPATPSDRDAVEFFLFESKQGYCDLFASSMVLMARSAGIPARYVTGFLPSEKRQQGDVHVVVQADAHAWAELYFKGHGWVVFDTTEGAQQVPEGERGETTAGNAWYQSDAFKTGLDIAIGVGVLVFAGLIFKGMRSTEKPDLNRQKLDKLYLRFTSLLQRHAKTRRDVSLTPDEFLQRVRSSLNGSYETARHVNDRFVRAFYAQEGVPESELAILTEELRNFEAMLKKEPTAHR